MNKKNGFTLIEILISITIASIFMTGVYSVLKTQIQTRKIQEQTLACQLNLRSAMYLIERDLQLAGYRGNLTTISTGFSGTCNATSVTFSYLMYTDDNIDNDSDGMVDESGERETVSYTLTDFDSDGDADDLTRTANGTTTAIAENVENIEFYYTETNDDSTTTPSTTPSNLALITSVQVSILVRSGKAVSGFSTGGRAYTTPSGDVWGDDENFSDGRIRRYETTNITCRNL